ncbi:MAG: hypothetical protein JXO51_02780 [Candidatus Aminicenantes bacterium]|nr:hypothetical protein [Candidatus Aminicenantes bacterium]
MLDYKDVFFSFQERRVRRRRRRLRWILLALACLAAFLGYRFLQARAEVTKVQELLLHGRLDEAQRRLQGADSRVFQRGNFRELLVLNDLFHGRLDEAGAKLAGLRRAGTATTLRSGAMLARFFDHGAYRELKIYSDYLLPRGNDEFRWFSALSHAAFMNPRESEQALAGLSASFQRSHGKALALLARFNRSLRSGRIEYVFDRVGRPLAFFDIAGRRTRSLAPGIDFSVFDAQLAGGVRLYRLTLDGELQDKVAGLFRGYFGSLVILNLPENGIAAAYSKPKEAAAGNAAFSQAYEPGSIVKIVTLLAFLRGGSSRLFPMDCPGALALDGKIFYDWIRHGRVRDPVHALALSCNVAFARMAEEVGFASLAGLLRRFSFNAAPFRDRFCEFAAGRFSDREGSSFQLAELAVGLREISITTIHAAVLAAVFSQNGQFFPPFLIDDVRNLLGLGFYRHEARPRKLLADDLNFMRVKKAMAEVVEEKNGTGRRARHPSLRLAIKTGTAGDSAKGLDSVIIGFFPFEAPRFAFALRLEGGGRADFKGALFVRELLDVLAPR